ncbi:hypothetical protein [Planctomicrobium sp. SH527]|uniref:hypothetical protein n=1 Tax=Planctomicrobium sp. SH527 TaxID=3448123 RepID=UPI003F5B3AAF
MSNRKRNWVDYGNVNERTLRKQSSDSRRPPGTIGFAKFNWDDFWQKHLEMSFNESTQDAFGRYEIEAIKGRDDCLKALQWLIDNNGDCKFAAVEFGGTWMMLIKTSADRPLTTGKRDVLEESLGDRLDSNGIDT